MKTFAELKREYNEKYGSDQSVQCFLPVHLTHGKVETNLIQNNGQPNEQYYKWQFLNCFVEAGLCSKDYIGVEVNLPKGNKDAAPIKLDGAIFDDKDWFKHYTNFHQLKGDGKWDEANWLCDHLLCGIEFKKEGGKDVKGAFNSQLKSYMEKSTRNVVFGILYDSERLYLFKSEGKKYYRLSDEFNNEDAKGKVTPTFDIPDPYRNLLSFDDMIAYDKTAVAVADYSGRKNDELDTISKADSKKLDDALAGILVTMEGCSLTKQAGYYLLIQMIALKIFDEKQNSRGLQFYINPHEINSDVNNKDLQQFLKRIEALREKASSKYKKILGTNHFNATDENHIKVAVECVRQFQNYSFTRSERSNLYQLVFYQFASQFSKNDNAQFVTPLQIIDFIVDLINPQHGETVIDPTVGVADFLSVAYLKSEGNLSDSDIYGMDIDSDMVLLATLNMLLNGDGESVIEQKAGLGSLSAKFAEDDSIICLKPKEDESDTYNYNGDWDAPRPDGKKIKKFDIVLTNPPFGEGRPWKPEGEEVKVAQCYELWNKYGQTSIDKGVVFLENAVRLLKDGGRMAIILSNSIASVDAHKKAREWLCRNMRIVAMLDLPANVFAEAGVRPTIIIAYKPAANSLATLLKTGYEVFAKDIKKIGYEVKTKNKVKCFEPQYKLNDVTFEKEINDDGTAKLDEEFTDTVAEFRQWCNKQEHALKTLFLKGI